MSRTPRRRSQQCIEDVVERVGGVSCGRCIRKPRGRGTSPSSSRRAMRRAPRSSRPSWTIGPYSGLTKAALDRLNLVGVAVAGRQPVDAAQRFDLRRYAPLSARAAKRSFASPFSGHLDAFFRPYDRRGRVTAALRDCQRDEAARRPREELEVQVHQSDGAPGAPGRSARRSERGVLAEVDACLP